MRILQIISNSKKMAVKCTEYPNAGVFLDPRTITSAKMPESILIYRGDIKNAFSNLIRKGYCIPYDISRQKEFIYNLIPYNLTQDKIASSHLFFSDDYLIEFFRTSRSNYKVYAMRLSLKDLELVK